MTKGGLEFEGVEFEGVGLVEDDAVNATVHGVFSHKEKQKLNIQLLQWSVNRRGRGNAVGCNMGLTVTVIE